MNCRDRWWFRHNPYKRKDGFKVIEKKKNPSKPTQAINAYANCKQEVKDAGYIIISWWNYEYLNYWYVGSTQSKKEPKEWVYDPRFLTNSLDEITRAAPQLYLLLPFTSTKCFIMNLRF